MQVVEQHRVDQHDPYWKAIDEATFASKNLYNATQYLKRQAYIHEGNRIISASNLDKLMQPTGEYRALPAKAEWEKHPSKFLGHPKLPKYLDKDGRNLLVYTAQAISRDPKNAGWVVPSGVAIRVATKLTHAQMAQVRLVPHATHYVVEVVYEREPEPAPVDPALIASIDLGVNNLAAITANKHGFVPLLVNGRPLKSLNQGYNKRRAQRQAALPPGQFTTRALDAEADYRQRAMTSYLHTASRAIIDVLVNEGIGTLVIGKNVGWKQQAHIGKRANQSFVLIRMPVLSTCSPTRRRWWASLS